MDGTGRTVDAGAAAAGAAIGTARNAPSHVVLHDMIWPETGLQTSCRVPVRPKDALSEEDAIELQIDFLTLALTPLEFIQLASFLRMSIDGLLDQHPGLQRAVIGAFDIRE